MGRGTTSPSSTSMPQPSTAASTVTGAAPALALYQAVGVERGDREASARQAFENFRFFGPPHVAIITTDAVHGVYGAVDTGLYVGTFLLRGTEPRLGAIPRAALASHSPSSASTSTSPRTGRSWSASRSACPTPTTRPTTTAQRGHR